MTDQGRGLSPRDTLEAEYHSGQPCDCYPPDRDRPVMECIAWADNIILTLDRAGYKIVRHDDA